MTTETNTTKAEAISDGNIATEQFVRWAAAQLELDLREQSTGVCELVRVEEDETGNTTETVEHVFRWEEPANEVEITVPIASVGSEVFRWIVNALQEKGEVVHARPECQPNSVHDITQDLFAAYEVDSGNAHLVGCNLEDRPFLRMSLGNATTNQIRHAYFSRDGEPVSEESIDALCLGNIVPVLSFPPRISDDQITLLVTAAKRHLQQDLSPHEASDSEKKAENNSEELLATALVWAKYVTGKLEFNIGEAEAELPFSGWARTLKPPPFQYCETGPKSFQLAATDDGKIVPAESIALCEESGKRVLADDLVPCSVTGKKVLQEFLQVCPVTQQPALQKEFATCSVCRQKVSKTALHKNICSACQTLQPVPADDPRIVWLLGEHPKLERFRKWKLSETAEIYIAQAATLWKRYLFIVDKETMQIYRVATRGALSATWVDMDEAEAKDLL